MSNKRKTKAKTKQTGSETGSTTDQSTSSPDRKQNLSLLDLMIRLEDAQDHLALEAEVAALQSYRPPPDPDAVKKARNANMAKGTAGQGAITRSRHHTDVIQSVILGQSIPDIADHAWIKRCLAQMRGRLLLGRDEVYRRRMYLAGVRAKLSTVEKELQDIRVAQTEIR